MNNFSDPHNIQLCLAEQGAFDIVGLARATAPSGQFSLRKVTSDDQSTNGSREDWDSKRFQADLQISDRTGQLPSDGSNSIYDFMPARTILSEKDQLRQLDLRRDVYKPKAVFADIIESKRLYFPPHLNMFTHNRGDIVRFSAAKMDGSHKLSNCFF